MRQVTRHVGLSLVFMVALLVGGCGQEPKKDNEQLKTQVASLQKENAALKTEMVTLKGENEAMKKQLDEMNQHMEQMQQQMKAVKPGKPARKR